MSTRSGDIAAFLFEKYGVPPEIVDIILREVHQQNFAPALNNIKNGRGISIKEEPMTWPRGIMYRHGIFENMTAHKDSNSLYYHNIWYKREVGPDEELYYYLDHLKNKIYKIKCDDHICLAVYHEPSCCATNFDLDGAPL